VTEDRTDQVTRALADVSERLTDYADVWRRAIERNARSAYGADDFLVDLQTLWGMSIRDFARVGFALAEAFAPSPSGERPAEEQPGTRAGATKPSRKSTKRASTQKSSARKRPRK
jgi:hypothetical protein